MTQHLGNSAAVEPTLEVPVVEMENVSKAYSRGNTRTEVLRGVSLRVDRGQCVMLVGPSGSGKSTLLSILGCILTADEGCVSIAGNDLGTASAAARIALRRESIGFVFQRFQLIRGLLAIDNVCVPMMICDVPPELARQRAHQLLADVGLGDQAFGRVSQLSAGQCQRVALARALANDPQLVLADEPTAALDAENGAQVMTLLKRLLAEQRKTAIVVTHDRRILEHADRVCILDGGRIVEANVAQRG